MTNIGRAYKLSSICWPNHAGMAKQKNCLRPGVNIEQEHGAAPNFRVKRVCPEICLFYSFLSSHLEKEVSHQAKVKKNGCVRIYVTLKKKRPQNQTNATCQTNAFFGRIFFLVGNKG